MATTSIEWTQNEDGSPGKVWNPTTGCDRVSPGCDNCYALTMAKRLKGMGQPRYQVDGDPRTSGPGFGLQMHPDTLDDPLRWRKPRKVFVNSMSDLFHPRVTDEFIAQVFAVMALADQHTFQVLTKRPKRMRALLGAPEFPAAIDDHRGAAAGDFIYPLPNVWLGTSVEDQRRADERIPALLDTPAGVRFLSCEPLLGPLTFRWRPYIGLRGHDHLDALRGIDWLIAGGESGRGARPMDPDWIRTLRDECQEAGTAFFFKQWGGIRPKAGGRELDGRTWDEYPEVARG